MLSYNKKRKISWKKGGEEMKIGVVLNSNDQESFNNALRFALVALEEGHEIEIFAMGKGVEALNNPEEKNLGLMYEILQRNGKIVA